MYIFGGIDYTYVPFFLFINLLSLLGCPKKARTCPDFSFGLVLVSTGISSAASSALLPNPAPVDNVVRDGRPNKKSKWDKVFTYAYILCNYFSLWRYEVLLCRSPHFVIYYFRWMVIEGTLWPQPGRIRRLRQCYLLLMLVLDTLLLRKFHIYLANLISSYSCLADVQNIVVLLKRILFQFLFSRF